jgi:hypothetical protein
MDGPEFGMAVAMFSGVPVMGKLESWKEWDKWDGWVGWDEGKCRVSSSGVEGTSTGLGLPATPRVCLHRSAGVAGASVAGG